MAVFSAWLSSRMAPRTERSASRLFGKGFSRVASAAIALLPHPLFAFCSPQLKHTLSASASAFPHGHFDNLQVAWVTLAKRQAGWARPNPVLTVRIVGALCAPLPRASTGVLVQDCESLRKSLKTSFAQKRGKIRCRGSSRNGSAKRKACGSGDPPLEGCFAQAGGLRFLLDADFDLRRDVAEHFDGHLRFADDPDGFGKLHLTLVDLEALRGQRLGNVRGRYRAEHLIVLARFARELQRDDIQQLGLVVRRFELRGGPFGQ